MRWGLGLIGAAGLVLVAGLSVVDPSGREKAVVGTSDPRFRAGLEMADPIFPFARVPVEPERPQPEGASAEDALQVSAEQDPHRAD